MADNHEIAFAEEAQEEVIISEIEHSEVSTVRRHQKQKDRSDVLEEELDGASEDTPLIAGVGGTPQRQNGTETGRTLNRRSSTSWTGGKHLSWYNTPSVSYDNYQTQAILT